MNDIFSKIIKNEMKSYKLYEDDHFIAILDIFPKTLGHFLVIPKKKSINLFNISEENMTKLIIVARKLAIIIVKKLGVDGFSLVINNGATSNQVVPYIHVHIIPSKQKLKLTFEELEKKLFVKSLN